MSNLRGTQAQRFFRAYSKAIKENPDATDQQHELFTFRELFNETLKVEPILAYEELTREKLMEFAWQMWKFGFAYDYPDDDYEETNS